MSQLASTPTPRQRAILAFIVRRCIASGGVPPTFREVGEAVGLRSTSVVRYHLRRLQDIGAIRMPQTSGSSRGIEVVGATWTPPPYLEPVLHQAGAEAAAA